MKMCNILVILFISLQLDRHNTLSSAHQCSSRRGAAAYDNMNWGARIGTRNLSFLVSLVLLVCLLQQDFVISKPVGQQLVFTQAVSPRKSVHIGGDVRIKYTVTNPSSKAVRGASINISLPSCLEILESSNSMTSDAVAPIRRLSTNEDSSAAEENKRNKETTVRSLSWTNIYVPKKTALTFEVHARVMTEQYEQEGRIGPPTLTFPATLSLLHFSSPVSEPVQIVVKETAEEAERDNHPMHHIPVAQAIRDHAPIEEKLHVITVITNPQHFATRYRLAKDFIRRMEATPNVLLYVAELCFNDQAFVVTEENHPRHLQLRLLASTPLWHKENLINLAVQQLLPKDWKAFAFIDADVEFTNPEWIMHTLRLLNGPFDIVQPYETGLHLGPDNEVLNIRASAAFQRMRAAPYTADGISNNFGAPGFAWAMTRRTYEAMGGLYEYAIVGAGDSILVGGLSGNMLCDTKLFETAPLAWKEHLTAFQERVMKGKFKLGATPGILLHHFHGKLVNRQYRHRQLILFKYGFDPLKHLIKNEQGVIVPTPACPAGLLEEIGAFFRQRQEDDDDNEKDNTKEVMRLSSVSR